MCGSNRIFPAGTNAIQNTLLRHGKPSQVFGVLLTVTILKINVYRFINPDFAVRFEMKATNAIKTSV